MTLSESVSHLKQLNDKLLEIYHGPKKMTEKKVFMAEVMNEYADRLVNNFEQILKEKERKNIKLRLTEPIKSLQKMIDSENNLLVKESLILSIMHQIIYEILSAEENYYLKLNGQEEMHIIKKPLDYYINISIKAEQNVFFYAFILIFALESLFEEHFYLGVDFEYTRKKIMLAQLCFEHSTDSRSFTYIVSPPELNKKMTDHFIQIIMCNKYVKKILHGSDSLDLPYVYEGLLEGDPDKIISFTRSMIDTRFLCEYYKLNAIDKSDNKCSIYDSDKSRSAIYYFGLISEAKQNDIAELLDSLPPVHDIEWNIHKLHKSQVLYAQYDVLFLKYFYYKMINMATKEDADMLGKKNTILLYKRILYEMTQFVHLEKKGITFLTKQCKEEVDPVNNFMVRTPKMVHKLIDVYSKVYMEIDIATPKVSLDKLSNVVYYKGVIALLLKKMAYTIISRKYTIYKDKITIWPEKTENTYIFEFLTKMGFKHLTTIFKDAEKTLFVRIQKILG